MDENQLAISVTKDRRIYKPIQLRLEDLYARESDGRYPEMSSNIYVYKGINCMQSAFSLLYVTDTHIGNDGSGWGHHPVRSDLVPDLMRHLGTWAAAHRVDMILHGGDITDDGSTVQQQQAKAVMSQVSVPVRLCLGNHDLVFRNALDNWHTNVPEFFEQGDSDYMVECGPMDLYVLTCDWRSTHNDVSRIPNIPVITTNRMERIERKLSERSNRPAMLAIHPSLESLPPSLTGLPEAIHSPPEAFARTLGALLDRHRNIRLLLGGHNHATCITHRPGRTHVSLSAFCEPPFQVMLILVDTSALRIKAFSPVDYRDYGVQCDPGKTWTAGRASDHREEIEWATPSS